MNLFRDSSAEVDSRVSDRTEGGLNVCFYVGDNHDLNNFWDLGTTAILIHRIGKVGNIVSGYRPTACIGPVNGSLALFSAVAK